MAKWIGLAMCMVIAAGWVLSFWVTVECRLAYEWLDRKTIGGRNAYLQDGCVFSGYFERTEILPPAPRWAVHRLTEWDFPRYRKRTYGFVWPRTGRGWTYRGIWRVVTIPVWALLVPTAACTAILFFRDRKAPAGHCLNCGYDLRGADHERCPECGVAVTEAMKPRATQREHTGA